MGCIRCGLCVDACTIEMHKFDKATLIDMRTVEQMTNPSAIKKTIRPRTVIYGSLLSVLFILFVTLVSIRIPLYITALRDRAMNSVFIPGIGYQNSYELHVGNMSHQDLNFSVSLKDDQQGRFEIVNQGNDYRLAASGYDKIRVLVRYKAEKPIDKKSDQIVFTVKSKDDHSIAKSTSSIFSYDKS